MKKLFIAIVLTFLVSTAWALPQGKPFQELESMIDMLAGDVTNIEGRVTQLEDTLAQLSLDVTANAEAIDTINDELDVLRSQIAAKQSILSGACPTGYALQNFDPAGTISCIAAGTNVQREAVSTFAFISPNRVKTTTAQCSPGFFLTGGAADYVGGMRGTQYGTAESFRAINAPAPFFAMAVVTAFCIK